MNIDKITIPGAEGKPILIDFHSTKDDESTPLVIFVHGFKGFKDWGTHHLVAEYFAKNGFSFLKFNFSHNGMKKEGIDVFDDLESFAQNTISKELSDLNEVITFAQSGSSFPPPSKTYLIGHSMGGAISILQASGDKRIDKIITWASISNFRGLWDISNEDTWRKNGVIYMSNSRTNQQMPLYVDVLEDLEKNGEKFDLLNSARVIDQPWLILHGDSDPTVPVGEAQLLKRQNANSFLYILESSDHVFNARHPWPSDQLPTELKKACDMTISFLMEE